jgi:hypothetical protein
MHTASELEWLRVRKYLRENRHALGIQAADGYPSAARVAGTALLAAPEWIPASPVPLEKIALTLTPKVFRRRMYLVGEGAGGVVPYQEDGRPYGRYSDAVRALDAPAIFENRPIYRLAGADLAGAAPRLEFGAGRYFDALDSGAAAAHEVAATVLRGTMPGGTVPGGTDPCDLTSRPAMMAVATLTLRVDREAGTASFPLHFRDPAKVGHAGGMYQVIPVGIFQPSGDAAWNSRNDFDLWRGMLREYAEELLGQDEDHDSERAPIDYDAWPFARRMSEYRASGLIRTWCVGLGVDPLTFATDLLTVAAFDAPVYDELFGALVRDNAEGTVIAARPFDRATVTSLISDYPMQAAGAALLALALRHWETLCSLLPAARMRGHCGDDPAVDEQVDAVEEARVVGQREPDDLRDFVRLAQPLQRRHRQERCHEGVLLGLLAALRGVDEAGRERDHARPEGAEADGFALREHLHPALGQRVRGAGVLQVLAGDLVELVQEAVLERISQDLVELRVLGRGGAQH